MYIIKTTFNVISQESDWNGFYDSWDPLGSLSVLSGCNLMAVSEVIGALLHGDKSN